MRSMTGYGQASWQGGGRKISVEIRSVNQRFLDVRLNLPRDQQAQEEGLRQIVQAAVGRGKVDVVINRSGTAEGDYEVEINEPLARAAVEGWRALQKRLGLPGQVDVSAIVGRGEFVRMVERRRADESEVKRIRRLMHDALREFNRARDREGKALARDMKARVVHLRRLEGKMRKRAAGLTPELAKRLRERLDALLEGQGIPPERLAQEAAVLSDRADVTEELVRLDSHLARLTELIEQEGAVGKPIDFLLQEVHREINTIASKSADLDITAATLEAKAEIEKLREQVQNVE
jgi:uncharacterized protein (TIGR00255 family)